jgi:hypothetical protein
MHARDHRPLPLRRCCLSADRAATRRAPLPLLDVPARDRCRLCDLGLDLARGCGLDAGRSGTVSSVPHRDTRILCAMRHLAVPGLRRPGSDRPDARCLRRSRAIAAEPSLRHRRPIALGRYQCRSSRPTDGHRSATLDGEPRAMRLMRRIREYSALHLVQEQKENHNASRSGHDALAATPHGVLHFRHRGAAFRFSNTTSERCRAHPRA